MSKKVIVICLCIAITSAFFILDWKKSLNPDYEKIANQITLDTGRIIGEKCGLYPIGLGGSMMDNIKKMNLSLRSPKPLTIDEGRTLIVLCIDTYLDQINKNEQVRPYLNHYPFEASNIEINIFTDKIEKGESTLNLLDAISNNQGIIRYHAKETEYYTKVVLTETYEEAKRIVLGE
ncbi:MAG: hypothetical protein KDK76_05660 [Chlamydiia bacterium]|nr:hypothetical protein [Chlamydiia bacterium]